MRTTVTIDPETERLIRLAMAERGQSFKQVINEAIQRALADVQAEPEPPFEVRPRAMGLRPGLDPSRLNALADELEADAYLELSGRARDRS
jgi:hypothetical protein